MDSAHVNGARVTHLVGSIPASDAGEAMGMALETLGSHVRWLSDGETGERFHWIVHIVDAMRSHPDLELAKDGSWSDYDDTPVFKIRKGHTLRPESLDFGHVRAFRESYPAFKAAREHAGRSDLAFQVGIPGALDMAAFVLGPRGALMHRRPFHEATVAEVRAIHREAEGDVLFQIEVPLELVFVARAPGPLKPLVAGMLARAVTRIAADAPAGARFGVHLCLGDMNHKALARMRDMRPVVLLANAIAARWPSGRPLEFVHAPFAGADQPPPSDPAYYAPLKSLELPPGTRFVAGLAFPEQDVADQRRLLGIVEQAVGRQVDLSTACGLGRRSRDEALAAMRREHELAEA